MSSAVERFDERMRRQADRVGGTTVHRGELLRHPVYTRVLHWLVAIAFILSLLSGFALYTPWLFQFMNWFAPMAWTAADRRWLKRMKAYTTNEMRTEPEDVGFFNGGQKIYFWAIVLSGLLFLISGLLMWFDHVVWRWLVAVSYVVHDLAALIMLAGFMIHIYEGTAAMPGTFRAMMNGTVTERWAWTHHPGWYRDVTGRDPAEAYEREKRRQTERSRAVESWEREQDAREH